MKNLFTILAVLLVVVSLTGPAFATTSNPGSGGKVEWSDMRSVSWTVVDQDSANATTDTAGPIELHSPDFEIKDGASIPIVITFDPATNVDSAHVAIQVSANGETWLTTHTLANTSTNLTAASPVVTVEVPHFFRYLRIQTTNADATTSGDITYTVLYPTVKAETKPIR